jgi:protein-S-isoprenylcysteine O-methyltransferase Ste14
MRMDILWLVGAWVGYFVVHSLLAANWVKSRAVGKGVGVQQYRLIYNIIALTTLVPVLFVSGSVESGYVTGPDRMLKLIGLIMAATGFILAKRAFKSYDAKAFLGLSPDRDHEEFKTDGMLKYVRHPVYSGSIVMLLGYFLFDPKWTTLVSVSMLIVYFVIGSYFEERKLIAQFGKRYADYRQKTPMFVPRLWNRR